MTDPYLGEVKIFAFDITPKGWMKCNGQTLAINQNTALFSILGTIYGGNGVTTFALPNLQGRAVLGQGTGYVMGEAGGEGFHTLTWNEMPSHTHTPLAGASAQSHLPAGLLPGPDTISKSGTKVEFYSASGNTSMHPYAVQMVGQDMGHDNISPSMQLNFCIATTGIFPTQSGG